MVGSAAPVALHGRKRGSVQGTSRGRGAGGESAPSAARAGTRKVAKTTAALIYSHLRSEPQATGSRREVLT
ncbi:hypothetical protein C8Q70DRAFT_992038 [Cubamyces menziesii]|nr:hypothetical protein C8Q70DRAFT_992038 [Cubamyces menziesii]